MKLRKRIRQALEACKSQQIENAMKFVADSEDQDSRLEAWGCRVAVCELRALLDDPEVVLPKKSKKSV